MKMGTGWREKKILEYFGGQLRACLVHVFKHMFSVFKQHYTYFHTLFHLHVFSKNTNNVTRTTLPNGSQILRGNVELDFVFFFLHI